jgi:cytochrome b involved in lipid metabolism
MEDLLRKKYSPKKVIVIDNNIYDVTEFREEHPGGEEILDEYMYKDVTNEFKNIGHSNYALKLLAKYLIGPLDLDSNNEKVNKK